MPRPTTLVKNKAIDLHFHGAFGIDLMTCDRSEFFDLCRKLHRKGTAGFLATTLSSDPKTLLSAVERLSNFVKQFWAEIPSNSAIPLGLHIEGPFLNPKSAGAHSPKILRKASIKEVSSLFNAGKGFIRVLTLAPEIHEELELKRLSKLAKKWKIHLSLGHSTVEFELAKKLFTKDWFAGLTHSWNAMPFHHRKPGPLLAALKHAKYIEIIPDGVHIHPEVVEATVRLAITNSRCYCFVSDCVPAGELRSLSPVQFGNLTIHSTRDRCVVTGTQILAGSRYCLGSLVPRLLKIFSRTEVQRGIHRNPLDLLKANLPANILKLLQQ